MRVPTQAKETLMAIDQTRLGAVAAELMDDLANHYGDDAELKNVVIIATVDHAGGTHAPRRSSRWPEASRRSGR